MIISHSHKFIFIKSFKTAGTSLESALSNHCSGDDVVTPLGDYVFNRNEKGEWIHQSMNAGDYHQHDEANTIRSRVGQEIWDNYFKFSITRNPWDRVVSLFNWKSRNDPEFKPRRRLHHRLGVPFNELRETRKLFSKFVKGEWKTNDSFYLFDDELCVEFVIRYENLEDDIKEVCRWIGVAEVSLPHLKSGFKQGYHYSEYYDDESKAIVAERHKNDIRLFGYKFDQV